MFAAIFIAGTILICESMEKTQKSVGRAKISYHTVILDSPRDTLSFDNFQKLKWVPVDHMFKLCKFGLLQKVIDGRAPDYLIKSLDSLRFEHKYHDGTRTKTLFRLPKPRTEAMRRTFF